MVSVHQKFGLGRGLKVRGHNKQAFYQTKQQHMHTFHTGPLVLFTFPE